MTTSKRPRHCLRAPWIRERTDDLKLLDDGFRPTVGDDDRKRILTRTDVNEINVYPIAVGRELSQRIQLCFHVALVVAAAPIPNPFLQLVQLRTLRPIGDGFFIVPSLGHDASVEVHKLLFRNLNVEGRIDSSATTPGLSTASVLVTEVEAWSAGIVWARLLAASRTMPKATVQRAFFRDIIGSSFERLFFGHIRLNRWRRHDHNRGA